MKNTFSMSVIAAIISSGAAWGAPVTPVSYDMRNGGFTYEDGTYTGGTGNPAVAYSVLTDGLGELTDGVIATANWNVNKVPFVGWQNTRVVNPSVTFNFDQSHDFKRITAHFDDSNGAGAVRPPSKIGVSGVGEFAVDDPAGSAPIAFVMDVMGLTTNSITLTFFHRNQWIMVSEVQFEAIPAAVVPVPAALPLLGAGLAALGLMHRRKSTRTAA